MNVIKIIMNVLPEKQKEVLQTLMSMVAPSEKEKGCIHFGIYGDIENEAVFILISEWKTRKGLEQHMQSDRFSVLLGTKSLLAEPMNIQILTISNSEGMEAVDVVRKKMKQIYPGSNQKGSEKHEYPAYLPQIS